VVKNDIYISISHAIADGRGAVLFGCSLIYEYLKLEVLYEYYKI